MGMDTIGKKTKNDLNTNNDTKNNTKNNSKNNTKNGINDWGLSFHPEPNSPMRQHETHMTFSTSDMKVVRRGSSSSSEYSETSNRSRISDFDFDLDSIARELSAANPDHARE